MSVLDKATPTKPDTSRPYLDSQDRDTAMIKMMSDGVAAVRKFETGATRDIDRDKLDYEAFLSPLVIQRYAEYLHKHRFQKDGTLRDGGNWKKGISRESYIKSAFRHFMDWWLHFRGYNDKTVEEQEDSLCAIIFNVSGYLHEYILGRDVGVQNATKNT